MLEGVVARLLNLWLGKYVLDLDTENLNVGIFSGHVQLTDLRLKPEALYELNIPIEIKFGTIGKVSIKIPWNALLNQPVVIHMEDVHILAGPVVGNSPYDSDKEKRLIRAAKRKVLSDLYIDGDIIGGPSLFPEHLVTSIINNFQVVIQNIHIRYEDTVSTTGKPIAAGLCISSISAETTNNKWKASSTPKGCSTGYHLLKIESFSVYWNHCCESQSWDWKTQYYLWRNAMTHSLQTFSMNDIDFDFLIKPMTCKIKFIINKSNGTRALKLLVDVVLQDFTMQFSRDQYQSIRAVVDSLTRMRTCRQFLYLRPAEEKITKTSAASWWKYAHESVLEQRVRPYTWSRVATVRANYRLYRDAYKKVLVNPNDTELKLDLQKYEDNLSLINIVIAREHAKIMLEQELPDSESSPLERGRSFWSMLPSPERGHLCQMIGYVENFSDAPSSCQYVEHKFNLTVSNFSLSLLCDGKEVLVATLTQVLASVETRSPDWYNLQKLSARAEGFVVEGASLEDHLVPLIAAQHHCYGGGGNITPNVFSLDFETLPSGSEANFKLWSSLEAIEITFYMHALREIFNFFESETLTMPDNLSDYGKMLTDKLKCLFCKVLKNRVDLNLDIKIPYLVISEYGSMTKSGSIMIIDFGRVVVRTELASSADNLEEATQMELEECAYSRVHIDLFHAQLLFCDSGENWRDARKETDTDMHIISKLNTLIVFALSSKLDHKTLPKLKLNVTVPSLKVNISERKIALVLGYLEHLEQVLMPQLEKSPFGRSRKLSLLDLDRISDGWQLPLLHTVRRRIAALSSERPLPDATNLRRASNLSALTDRSAEPSEYSSENSEAWARCVDLPGLEDNVSPHNTIQELVRIILGELCIVLSRSSERVDRAYLMLRAGKACLDLALMDYGPAMQLSVHSISLTDKLHTSTTGQYLDLIHVPAPAEHDFLMVLYRKVRADCPDFRSHFHSVEKSLVADFGPVHFLVHRDAIRALVKYAQYLYNKIQKHTGTWAPAIFSTVVSKCQSLTRPSGLDPPVPPGAVKFSNSARLQQVVLRLCDADRELLEARIAGLECDFMFRANERLILRAYLGSLNVEHLAEVTLYSKVLVSDEDKVFEVKYVRHTAVNTDGSIRVHVGRMQVTLLYKLMLQVKHFTRPFIAWKGLNFAKNWLEDSIAKALHPTAPRNHLSITIHGPTLLLPQKTASPNLVVIHTGELNIENFFKESSPNKAIIENILIKLEGTTILRAVMTLASSLETQEAILEPMSIRLDIKKTISCPKSANLICGSRIPSWEIDGVIDVIKITLGQRDLTTLLAVYTDNINEGHFVDFSPDSGSGDVPPPPSPPEMEDRDVKSLEAFFCQSESKYKDICVKMNLEGILLSLFCDCEEVLSSPVRDMNHGLCRLEIGDTVFSADLFTDHSLEAKLSVQSVTVIDIRPEISNFNNVIFQSHREETKANTYQISVSTPPVIDISFHQNNNGDRFVDVIVERVCLSVSVPFLGALGRFVFESLPCERRHDGGIVNHGYVADQEQQQSTPTAEPQDSPGLTIAVRMCKPEFVFLADAQIEKGNNFVTKAEILVDYSRHSMRENLIISLSNFHILFNSTKSTESYILLHPCDFEFSKCFKIEDGVKSTLTLSTLQIHLCAGIFLTLIEILEDIYLHLNPPTEMKPKFSTFINRSQDKGDELDDLWSPKRLSQNYTSKAELQETTTEILEVNKMFIASIASITIVLELEGANYTAPTVLIQSSVEATIHDWSRQLHGTIEIHLQANYFNEQVESWEPLIEPVVLSEGQYRPWELVVRVFQSAAALVSGSGSHTPAGREQSKNVARSVSSSGDEDSSTEGGMTFLRPKNASADKQTPRLTTSLAAFLEDEDSETEDGTMEKLAAAICDLFTGDWNESEDSDCGHSSGTDQSGDSENEVRRQSSNPPTAEQLATFVLLDSRDILNITLTSQALKLFHELVVAYTDRTKQTIVCNTDHTITLINDIGPKSKVELLRKAEGDSEKIVLCSKTFEKVDSGHSSPTKSLEDLDSGDESINSNCSEGHARTLEVDWQQDRDIMQSLVFPEIDTAAVYRSVNEEQISVELPNFTPLFTSCPRRTWCKLLRLQSPSVYHLLAEHWVTRTSRTLIVASPLQLRNETSYPLGLFYERAVLSELGQEPVGEIMNPFDGTARVAVLEPHDEYNVPLHIAYHCKLFLQPAFVESYGVSSQGLWWPELAADLGSAKDVLCEPKPPAAAAFSLRVRTEERDPQPQHNTRNRTIPLYLIRLLPPLIIHNCLPYSIQIKLLQIDQQIHVDSGDKSTLYSLNIQRTVKLSVELNYLGLIWTGSLNLTTDLDEKMMSMVTDYDTEGGNKQLSICVRVERTDSCELYFYSPYWIVNKTGLPLQLRGCVSNVVYDIRGEDALLFAYKRQARSAVRIRAYQSSWSAEFSLDAVGTSGLVLARDKERGRRYPILLTTALSNMAPRFTKIVTLLPNWLVSNNTKRSLRFMEENERTDLWLDLAPNQCVPFWPETQSMQMYVKYRDSQVVSQNFSISRIHQTTLRMERGGAVCVEVHGGREKPFCVAFRSYRPGDAPCRIDNHCTDLHLKLSQRAQPQVALIAPLHSLLYTWDDPCADRTLMWNVYNNKGNGFPLDIYTDGYGEARIRLHTVKQGAVSSPSASGPAASSSSDSDSSSEERPALTRQATRRDKVLVYWLCYMDGRQRTVLFTQDARLAHQLRRKAHHERTHWETALSLSGIGVSLCLSHPKPLEFAYFSLGDSPALWEVNIAHKWKMLTLELASWVEDKYKTQQKKCQLKDYVHIDFEKMYMLKPFYGELRRTYHPALWLQWRRSHTHEFWKLKLNTLALETQDGRLIQTLGSSGPKPWGVSCLEMQILRRLPDAYKAVTLNVGEFYINVDREFIEQLHKLIDPWLSPRDPGSDMRLDMTVLHLPLATLAQQQHIVANNEERIIIEKLRLAPITLHLNVSAKKFSKKVEICDLLDYIFNCLEISYAPVKQNKYVFTAFELENISTSHHQLWFDIVSLYRSELLQQFHVHVLGQSVLLNPYTGTELVSIQPPLVDTVCQEVERTCRAFLGHVHSAAPPPREHLRRRRFQLPVADVRSIANRAFVVGVPLGLAAPHSGVEAFFRGSGKALASLMTRGGVSDCVEVATDAIRRAALMGERVQVRHRLHRYIHPRMPLKPFSVYEAMGNNLLKILSNGRYFETDTYWAHAPLNQTGKQVLLITLQHIFLVENCRHWSPWDIEWTIDLDNVVSVPKIIEKEIIIEIRQDDVKQKNSPDKYVIQGDPEILSWLKEKIEQALVVSMEDKCWPSLDH